MPFAPRIRKDILKALEEFIIPALWKQQVALGYVAPPLQFPQGITKRLLRPQVPRVDADSPGFPIQYSWTKAKLHSTHLPYISFIYEGIADERTLVTAEQSRQYNIAKGIYALRWEAPAALFFPPGAPRNTGGKIFWEDSLSQRPPRKILQLFLGDESRIHTANENSLEAQVSHSLQVNDASLRELANLLREELHQHPVDNQDAAQAALLTLMIKLRNFLSSHRVSIANSSYPIVPSSKSTSERNKDAWRNAADFIQMHLHESLSLPLIARKVELSPAHLNRLSQQFSGVSVMRYVRQQRINAAKQMLEKKQESIKEIALLLNFKQTAAFCSAFRRDTGMTPSQFRRRFSLDNHK